MALSPPTGRQVIDAALAESRLVRLELVCESPEEASALVQRLSLVAAKREPERRRINLGAWLGLGLLGILFGALSGAMVAAGWVYYH